MSLSRDPPGTLPHHFSPLVLAARRFYLRRKRELSRGFEVVGAGRESCRGDYVVDRPGFTYPTVEFVASGAGTLVIHNRKHALVPGTVFAYGKKVGHRMVADASHPMVKYFLVMRGADAEADMTAYGAAPGVVGRVREPERLRQVFDDLIAFGMGDRTDRADCCRDAARYLLMMIRELQVPSGLSSAHAYATYERCRLYMETHWLRLIRVSDAATACHVDPAYLCRLFQRFGRERPFHYLQHLRMNHAMAQLQGTERMIKDIAGELGYEDAANFTRAFRSWFGVAPMTIRARG
jgi:AraC-like DNA-binding protein